MSGILETPIALVSTNNVGRAADAMVDLALDAGITDVAASTTHRVDRDEVGLVSPTTLADASLAPVFTAVVDAAEEAVVNALFVADTVFGRDGNMCPGLPVDRVLDAIRQ